MKIQKQKNSRFTTCLCGILSFLLCVTMLSLPVWAEGGDGFYSGYLRYQDLAALTTAEEQDAVNERLDTVSEALSFDVVVVLTNDIDGYSSVQAYADDFYDSCDFGYGDERDGALLLVSMEERDWYISTKGYGLAAFHIDDINYMGEQIAPYLSGGDYVQAFYTFAKLVTEFVQQARGDTSTMEEEPNFVTDGEREEGKHASHEYIDDDPIISYRLNSYFSLSWLLIALAVGLLLSLITVGVMRGKLKTVRRQARADSYIRKDSMDLQQSSDTFLYSQVTRTEKPQDTDNASDSGAHVSSSGSTHGGGGGKF